MNTDELIATLDEAGLSPYQSAAYVSLLELGRVSAQELATASDVPGPRIYDVLDSLEEKGFITTYEREQLYAEAVAPDTGVSALTSRIDQLSDAVEEIQTRWHQPTSDIVDIGVVKQFETVLARSQSNIEAAQRQVLVALTFDQFLALESTLRAAHQRGISIQIALHYSPERSLSAETFAGACTEVRVGETPCMYEPFIT